MIRPLFKRPTKPVPNKLAELELLFEEGPLRGLKLVGFTIWKSRGPQTDPDDGLKAESRQFPQWSLTFPARSYRTPTGQMRNYALLRAITEMADLFAFRDVLLNAYQQWELSEGSTQAEPDWPED